LSKRDKISLGKSEFKKIDTKEKIDKSPSPKIREKEYWRNHLLFCQKELKIHITNENHRMIGYKMAEIKECERKING